jgi:hypothetical protein
MALNLFNKPKKPKQPNVNKLANQQFRLGKKAAIFSQGLGAINQTAPGGTVTYQRGKGGRIKSVTTAYDKPSQEYYDTASDARNRAVGALPDTPFVQPDDTRANAVREALYKRRLGMIEPQLANAEQESQRVLMERGIPIGSEIHGDERERLAQERENAYTSIAQDAELAAGAESDRTLAQALTVRNQPYNEFASVVSAAPMSNPSFQSMPGYSVGQPDVMGSTINQYNQNMTDFNTNRSGLWNGLFDLGSAGVSRIGAGR